MVWSSGLEVRGFVAWMCVGPAVICAGNVWSSGLEMRRVVAFRAGKMELWPSVAEMFEGEILQAKGVVDRFRKYFSA